MKNLFKIIEETPLAFRKSLLSDDLEKEVRGKTIRVPYAHIIPGFNKYGIVLNLQYSNMGETLVHEALHIRHPMLDEINIEDLTNVYWNKYPTVRKCAQRRIVEVLTEYDI